MNQRAQELPRTAQREPPAAVPEGGETRTAAPARMTSAWAPTAKETALAVPTPLAIRIAAPAPAWVAAPAGAIGRAPRAAAAQRKAIASGSESAKPSAWSRRKRPNGA